MRGSLGGSKRFYRQLESEVMGYVEMIKVTDAGRVAKWINADGEMVIEKAELCDNCGKYRPASQIKTTTFADGEWIQFCRNSEDCGVNQTR